MSTPLNSIYQSAVALAAHTGTVAETTLLSIPLPALGANDQVSVAITLSRPASQSAEAALLLRLNTNLAQRWRIGTGRGGAIGPEPVLTNRNSTSSQLLGVDASNDGLVLTGTVDTSVATTLALSAVLGATGDALTIESVTVTLSGSGATAASGILAALSTVKGRLLITDTTDDTLLTNLLELATGRFNRFCNRIFARTASATYEFGGDEQRLAPPCYPIESVATWALKSNETDGYATQTGVSYLIRRGCILELSVPLGTWLDLGRVTYTGGYVLPGTTPDTGQTALPDEVEHACVEQVAHWYINRHRLGLASIAGEGGSVSQLNPTEDLLPTVKAVLQSYRRINA